MQKEPDLEPRIFPPARLENIDGNCSQSTIEYSCASGECSSEIQQSTVIVFTIIKLRFNRNCRPSHKLMNWRKWVGPCITTSDAVCV
jgi:hypothetical protein